MISASSAAWERWAPEAAESIMPTCGMSRQGLLAGAETDTHKKSSLKGRENKSERGGSRERLIKGERDGTHMAPQVQCCISNPGCERIEGLQVNQSLH